MKKTILSIVLLSFVFTCFSQEKPKQLTDAQKDELRKKHNSGLNFSTKNKSNNSSINFTSSKEQSESNLKTTTKVKYYYGKEDSLYKEFEYKKP